MRCKCLSRRVLPTCSTRATAITTGGTASIRRVLSLSLGLKKNANVARIRELTKTGTEPGIESAEVARFNKKILNTKRPNRYFGQDVRRIRVNRDGDKPDLILITNDFKRSAQQIAALYTQRWQIELFFKWIKQHLKLK